MAKFTPNKNKKNAVRKIQDTEGGNFGNYKEATGGGHPFEHGNSNTRTTRENGKTREAENPTTSQPRTDDGKFTYKSANGKSIDPKYGPSRGKTVNPLLTGGENGVMIEDVEKGFKSQSGSYWDKYKDKWFTKGGKVVTQGLSTKVSAQTIWALAKQKYDVVKGEFEGESENWSTKGGKKSAAEKEAIQKVKATGEQQYAIDKATGAIETKGGMAKAIKEFVDKKTQPKEEIPAQTPAQAPAAEAPAPAPDTSKMPWGKSGKFSVKDSDTARANIKEMMGGEYDEEFWTDDVLEEFMEGNPTIYAQA